MSLSSHVREKILEKIWTIEFRRLLFYKYYQVYDITVRANGKQLNSHEVKGNRVCALFNFELSRFKIVNKSNTKVEKHL